MLSDANTQIIKTLRDLEQAVSCAEKAQRLFEQIKKGKLRRQPFPDRSTLRDANPS
jgi:hypothetical protein